MDIATALLEHGAKPNVASRAGFTPLHLSAQKGHYDMTNLLIEHGGDPNRQAKVLYRHFYQFFRRQYLGKLEFNRVKLTKIPLNTLN